MRPPYFTPKFVFRSVGDRQRAKFARTLSIAIVEDDPNVCQVLGRSLRDAGMTTVVYPSVEIFRTTALPESFDCLVFDALLADLSGLDLHELQGESGSPPPVFLLMSEDESPALAQALAAGGFGCFWKSGCGEEAVEVIRRAVADTKFS